MNFFSKLLIGIFAGFSLFNLTFAFGDVPADDVNYHIIQHLHDVNIMKAYNDGNFYPEKFVTRAEAITVALRAGGIIIPTNFDSTKIPFADVNPNEWYAPAIARANEIGLIHIESGANFAPNAAITKAEFLAFLFNATNVNLAKYAKITRNIANDIVYAI